MEKKQSLLRRSLAKAFNLPWFGAKREENFFADSEFWQPVTGRQKIGPVFDAFTAIVAEHCRQLSQQEEVASWLMERGTLADGARYFYFQRFDEEGMLIQQTDHGWFSIPAVKVVADDSFIRGQVVAETATVMIDPQRPNESYVRSILVHNRPALIQLYADAYVAAFT